MIHKFDVQRQMTLEHQLQMLGIVRHIHPLLHACGHDVAHDRPARSSNIVGHIHFHHRALAAIGIDARIHTRRKVLRRNLEARYSKFLSRSAQMKEQKQANNQIFQHRCVAV